MFFVIWIVKVEGIPVHDTVVFWQHAVIHGHVGHMFISHTIGLGHFGGGFAGAESGAGRGKSCCPGTKCEELMDELHHHYHHCKGMSDMVCSCFHEWLKVCSDFAPRKVPANAPEEAFRAGVHSMWGPEVRSHSLYLLRLDVYFQYFRIGHGR